jgi:hypothetical protein
LQLKLRDRFALFVGLGDDDLSGLKGGFHVVIIA